MRGLDPRIHAFLRWCVKDVDGRVKPGHDDVSMPIPAAGTVLGYDAVMVQPGYLAARSFSAAAAAK